MILFAQDFRPDYKIAQVNREIAELRQRAARRDLLPQLDAYAQYTTTGFDDSRGDSVDTLFSDYNGWSTGLMFSYPLFNRRARGLHAQSLDRVEQAEIALDNTELLITTEVRAATRALRTTSTQVEAARRNVQAELERVRAERQRLEVGDRTVFNVLDSLDDLVEAQSNLVRALADFQIALIALGRSTGTILWAQGIEVEDQEAPGLFTLSFDPRASSRATTSNAMGWADMVRSAPNIREGAAPNPNPVPAPPREPASPQATEPVRAPE
jgi:outer membrane protein TolC